MDWNGLAASTWDDLHEARAPDHDFYLDLIKSNPGKVLDVGCGTGRILVPFLEERVDVEGIDTSGDMLAVCRKKIKGLGLQTNLYQGSMQSLDLPSRYATLGRRRIASRQDADIIVPH